MMAPRRDWTEMTWEDFSGADPSRWIAVLPIAAVEQHGPHLPVGTDAFIAQAYLDRVRRALPQGLAVTFLPTLTIATSDEHRAFPGTLTLAPETVLRMLTEIGRSVHRSGVRKLVIVSSHGGNSAVIALAARELRVQPGLFTVASSWSRFGYPEGLFSPEERLHGIHAGDIETSIMLADRPETVRAGRTGHFPSATLKMETEFTWLRAERPAGFGWAIQDLNRSGAVGDASAGTARKGEAALEFGARAFVELLIDVERFDPGRLEPGPLGDDSASQSC
jgi:creatinine amidohydrolase